MTREEMIKYAMEHPFARISHKLFNKDEWLYTDGGTFFMMKTVIYSRIGVRQTCSITD